MEEGASMIGWAQWTELRSVVYPLASSSAVRIMSSHGSVLVLTASGVTSMWGTPLHITQAVGPVVDATLLMSPWTPTRMAKQT